MYTCVSISLHTLHTYSIWLHVMMYTEVHGNNNQTFLFVKCTFLFE